MGPDEYHDGYPDQAEGALDNNTYTNVMAHLGAVPSPGDGGDAGPDRVEVTERIGPVREELERWEEVIGPIGTGPFGP